MFWQRGLIVKERRLIKRPRNLPKKHVVLLKSTSLCWNIFFALLKSVNNFYRQPAKPLEESTTTYDVTRTIYTQRANVKLQIVESKTFNGRGQRGEKSINLSTVWLSQSRLIKKLAYFKFLLEKSRVRAYPPAQSPGARLLSLDFRDYKI